jgi:Ca-activated chloride channel family protein
MIRFRMLYLLALLTVAGAAAGQSGHRELRRGDRYYDKEQYQQAADRYREALKAAPNDPRASYNTGNAIYRQGQYEEATSLLQQAAEKAKDPGLKADALHNLGNAYLKQEKYKEAIGAYEGSLRARPNDPATQQNLQYAKKKLQAQQPPPPQPQPQPQRQQQQKQKQQQQPEPQPTPRQQQQQRQMTKEEAERLLKNTIEQEDRRNAQKYREGQQPPPKGRLEKDW